MLTASEARSLKVTHDYGVTKARIERLIQIAAQTQRAVTVTLNPSEILYFTQYLGSLGYTVERAGSEQVCVRW